MFFHPHFRSTCGVSTPPSSIHPTGRLPSRRWPSLFSLPNSPDCEELVGHDGCVNHVIWSEDGNMLLTASDDRKIGFWGMARGMTKSQPYAPNPSSVGFGPGTSYGDPATSRSPRHLHQTAHFGNIFWVSPSPAFDDCREVLSVALDGTLCYNTVETETSEELPLGIEPSGNTMKDLGRKCQFLPQNPQVALVAIRSGVLLYDLRVKKYSAWIQSSNFNLVPSRPWHEMILTDGANVSWMDFRLYRGERLHDNALQFSGLSVSGVDVTGDGKLVAVSTMWERKKAGALTVLPIEELISSGDDVRFPRCSFTKHRNEQTFLKAPSFFWYDGGWCVATGSDFGEMRVYEVPNAFINDQEGLKNQPLSDVLQPVPSLDFKVSNSNFTQQEGELFIRTARTDISSRRTFRTVDSQVCNVVAPHPSLKSPLSAAQQFHGAAFPMFACSGIDSTVKIVKLTSEAGVRYPPSCCTPSDNRFAGIMQVREIASRVAIMSKSVAIAAALSAQMINPEVRNSFVGNAVALCQEYKALGTAALQQRGRLHVALELYLQPAILTMRGLTTVCIPESDAPELYVLIVQLLGNAALTAGKLDMKLEVLNLCSAVLEIDPSNAKAYFRRATVRYAMESLTGALEDIDMASNLTNGEDPAVEAMKRKLMEEKASRLSKERKKYARMFGD